MAAWGLGRDQVLHRKVIIRDPCYKEEQLSKKGLFAFYADVELE